MKKNIQTGAKVITFLASCGKDEIGIEDLFVAVVKGFKMGDDLEKAYCMVSPTLQELASEDMVSLSEDKVSPASDVPGVIRIRPKMQKAAEVLMHGKASGNDGKAAGRAGPKQEKERGGRQKDKNDKKNAIESRYYTFVDLMDKKGKKVRVGGEWNRLVTTIIYQDIEENTGFHACVESFVNGLIWRARREEGGDSKPAQEEQKAELKIRPELLGQIDAILKADEEKNGEMKGRKTRRRLREDDAPLTGLDRAEIWDFIRSLTRMRDDIHPGKLWQQAMSMFFGKLLENMPVYEACREAFRAGIVFQMHRKKLEG